MIQYYISFDLSPFDTDVSIVVLFEYQRALFRSSEMFILKSKTQKKRREEIDAIVKSICEKHNCMLSDSSRWKIQNMNLFKCDLAIKLDSKYESN